MRKAEKELLGVGESGNESAGTLQEKHIASGVKQGVCWTGDKPPDPGIHQEMIRGWEEKKRLVQKKRGHYFHRKQ